VDEFGSKLHFGKISYQNSYVSRFQERVNPRDVKAALVLLSYLKLEHHTVDVGDSLLFDSSMLLIKASLTLSSTIARWLLPSLSLM